MLVVAFGLLVTKMVALQVVDADRYKIEGTQQRAFTQTLAADRGNIYDRNGAELVVSKPAQSVFVDPALIEDPHTDALQVAQVLGLDAIEVEADMRVDGRFAYVARKVTYEQAEQIEALGLNGVGLVEESSRHKPSGLLGRSVLGSVDTDNVGTSGIELIWGEALTGMPGQLTLERNPEGATIATGEHNLRPAERGDDLMLTIDRSLQYEAERILAEQVTAVKAKGGTAIVTDPATGEILAMANVELDEDSGEVVVSSNNMAVTGTYEPGSTMKMITVSAALDSGKVGPDTMIDTPHQLDFSDDYTITDEHSTSAAKTVSDVVAYSSNTGTINIAKQVGNAGLHDQLEKFGLNTKTALDFPNEADGYLSDVEDWSDLSRPTIAIGQGVAVTPMQMIMAYNVIANGGLYVAPNLVKSTVDSDGVTHRITPDEGHRVVSEQTADQLNVMLREVVMEGTGTLATVPGYVSAGKTGTPWKAIDSGYTDSRGNHQYQPNFVGFVPAQDPQLSVLVMIDEPDASIAYTGGAVAAPVFAKIAAFALQLFGIPAPLADGSGSDADAASAENGDADADALAPGVVRGEDGRIRGLPSDQAPPAPILEDDTTTSTKSPTH